MDITQDELARRFSFHPADTPEKQERHEAVRRVCLAAADELVLLTGPLPTREQSLAITHLEEVMFWANAAIARNNAE